MKDEIAKIREEQNANLIAILKAQKSDYDPDKLGDIINKKSEIKVQAKESPKGKGLQKSDTKDKKKLRFDQQDEDSAEFIRTNSKIKETKGMSMFDKVPIKRTQLLTPKGGINSLEDKLKDQDSGSGSIQYSDNFEPDESLAASKAKGLYIKTKSDINDDIVEEIDHHDDEMKDTITERIGEDYSMGFEEISESIAQSKTLGKKSKFSDSKPRLNSRYSGSRISEEDIPEDIDESIHIKSKDHDAEHSSSHTHSKIKASKTKPDIPNKKSKQNEKFPQNKLIEKLQENNMNDFINTISKGIEYQYKEEHGALVREYSDNKISENEYARRKHILDEWKEKEMKDIAKKRMLIEGWVQMNEIVAKMKSDDDSIGHSSGSIKDLKKAPKYLFSKPDFNAQKKDHKSSDSDFNQEDDSNDSIKVRMAKKQLRDMNNYEDEEDSANEHIVDEAGTKMKIKSTKKKKLAANKLLAEKEKAIQDGLRQKMLELEENHAKNLLDEALKIDVKKEIEKRFNMIIDIDNEQKEIRKRNELYRQRKLEESIEESSMGYKPSKVTDKGSIDASRHTDNEESITSVELKKIAQNRNKVIQPSSTKEDIIKEDTIQESLDDYSNDFGSVAHSQSNVALNPSIKKQEEKKSPINEAQKKLKSDVQSEIDEEYSVDFDESNPSISNLNQSIKSAKNANKDSKAKAQVKEEIKEVESDEEDDKKKPTPKKIEEEKINESRSASIIEETPEDSEAGENEEIVHRIPTGKSDDYLRKVTDSASSTDLEVLDDSHKSVDWVMEVPIQKPDSNKLVPIQNNKTKPAETNTKAKKAEEIDDIEEDYEDDFENSSNKSNKESTPRVGDPALKSDEYESDEEVEEKDIMDDHEKLADIMTEDIGKFLNTSH